MVYAHRVTRVTLSGTMFGSEEWSTGFFLGQESADATEMTQLGTQAIMNAWRTYFISTGANIANSYSTLQCKSALIDADGLTILDTVQYAYPTSATAGAINSLNTHPAQCALVATLLSDRPRGKASKGRMYLPGISAKVETNGKISSVNLGNIADGLKTFFDALTGHIDIPDQLILAAKGTGPFPALTAQNDYVETIKIGDVIDTQRRRRNAMTETYTSRVLV